MTSDDHPDQSRPDPAGFGPAIAHHAWRLSGRIVAGVGQLLLWILTGIGRLLRPLGVRLGAKLYGAGRPPQAPGPDGPAPPGAAGAPGAAPADATAPLPRWINMWREVVESWYFAPLTGLALAIAALAELAPQTGTPLNLAGGFAVAATLPLVWRREYLRPVAAVVLGAFAASLLTGQVVLFTTSFAALYTLYALGRQLPRQSAGALAVGAAATVAVVYLATSTMDDVPWPATAVAVLAAIGLGDARRVVETAGRTQAEAHERNNETLTRLTAVQREQAVMRERARIARELHDVVAHSVSMIAVQAETAPYTMESLSPEARAGYTEIAKTAREALVEMRRLLSVLRADAQPEPESATAPQPRLDRLPDLIDQHRGAGGRVDLAVHGDPRDLSTTVELSAYRIVQEALTNARRHAPGSEVRVDLTYLPDRLAVTVRDRAADAQTMVMNRDGTPSRTAVMDPGGGAADPAGRTRLEAAPAAGSGGGHGLVGMRERATMLGGRFSAGPATEGGFLVEAELPLTREENPTRDPGSEAPPGRR
ncbi:sensor histidine kinase [Actinomadura xylanilytica]|uniref:sensor histidine kinase n=1 Tax=Actinomadura xylanilytica TaxID=887459 RepID=UPI00255AA92E|nr:histidine kinase [Actinomadura xylanilytica]MDL4776029.1 histidine kinase [Actinomadura xylanilytica]